MHSNRSCHEGGVQRGVRFSARACHQHSGKAPVHRDARIQVSLELGVVPSSVSLAHLSHDWRWYCSFVGRCFYLSSLETRIELRIDNDYGHSVILSLPQCEGWSMSVCLEALSHTWTLHTSRLQTSMWLAHCTMFWHFIHSEHSLQFQHPRVHILW